MELRTFKYRIYPSRKQKERLFDSFKTCKKIFNELLATSSDSWKYGRVSLGKFDFTGQLRGRYVNIFSQVKQNVADRVQKALENFYRRAKSDERKKGFPRFKSRVNSITFPQFGFKFLSNKILRISKIGKVSIILHRVPRGKIKTLTIKHNRIGQWFAIFVCETKTTGIQHPSMKKVGIDVGIETFATMSTGDFISKPAHYEVAERRIKVLQRRLSRKKKGSMNREKARVRLARTNIKVANKRADFLHKLSHRITKSYSFIAVEDLNIKSMVKKRWFGKRIYDASWGSFVQMLSYKAVTCGGQLVKVDPRNTSKTCSSCGRLTNIPLSKRKFVCPFCGFVCHRDLNASHNILRVGQGLPEPNACEHDVRPFIKAIVDETGTIFGNS